MLNFAQIPILGGNRFHPYYRAILNRALSLGYTLPSSSQQALQNRLVLHLVNNGIWNKLDLLYIFATNAGSNFSRINWITPASFELTAVNSPTFTSNVGWTGNGTSAYLDTGWVASTHAVNYTIAKASYGCKIVSGSAGNSGYREMGAGNGGIGVGAYIRSRNLSGQIEWRINDDFNRTVATDSANYFWHVNRVTASGTAAKELFRNGSSLSSANDNGTEVPAYSFIILGINNVGTIQNFTNRQLAMAFVGGDLFAEASSFYTGWNNYYTSI